MDGSGTKTVQLQAGGILGFIVGSVLGQIAYGLVLGVPLIVVSVLVGRAGGNVVLWSSVAGAFGAAISFFVGFAFGLKARLDRWFVVGAVWIPLMLPFRMMGILRGADDAGAFVMLGAYTAAGVAMAAGFVFGRWRQSTAREMQPT